MFVDIYDYTWQSKDNQRLYRIIDMDEVSTFDEDTNIEDEDVLVWYKDLGTNEIHCMTTDIFLLSHEACGQHEFALND